MMEVIIDKNTTIEKEKLIIESLELLLKEDSYTSRRKVFQKYFYLPDIQFFKN